MPRDLSFPFSVLARRHSAARASSSAPGARPTPPQARRLLDLCLDAGVTMFDTADIYSQRQFGGSSRRAMKGRRDQALISTKATFRFGDEPNDVGSSRHHLLKTCEDALKRLQTDYIDLFQLHGFDAMTPPEEVLSHARRSRPRRQDPLRRRFEFLRLASDEVAGRRRPIRLSALRREPDLLFADRPRLRVGADAARARSGLGAVVWSPLGWGRLTGKIRRGAAAAGDEPPAQDGRQRPAGRRTNTCSRVVDALDEVAKETGKSIPQIALNWLLQRPTVSTVIIGARNEEQLKENLGAVGWNLTHGANRKARRCQRDGQGLSLLAPDGFLGTQPAARLTAQPTHFTRGDLELSTLERRSIEIVLSPRELRQEAASYNDPRFRRRPRSRHYNGSFDHFSRCRG